jgi:uncharacterized lipoprotein YmbA
MNKATIAILMTTGLILVAGCSRSPRANFYTLTATAPPPAAAPKTVPSLVVDAVTLPEVADRPQFVMTSGDNRVEILEMQQWAESLGSAIPRVLADNLSRQLGLERVAAYPQLAGSEADYHLSVDFQRFEATANLVTVDALWSVRSAAGTPITGRSRASEPRGEGYDSIATAYSRALATVSGEIARAMQKDLKM